MMDQPILGIDAVSDPSSVRVVLYNGVELLQAPLDDVGLVVTGADATLDGITAGSLRLTDTGDAALASTDHAFQIGPDASANLIMDQNELMARSNGAAAGLFLNNDGGLVTIGSGGLTLGGTLTITTGAVGTGTWTPTLTNTANVDSTTAAVCHYIRIGDHVMCFGVLTVDPTLAAGTTTTVGISLPIASNFAATTDLRGSSATAAAQRGGSISADAANDRATLNFLSETTAATGFSFTFGYQII